VGDAEAVEVEGEVSGRIRSEKVIGGGTEGNSLVDYHVLGLVDNTATVNRVTMDRFPFVSYAKSIVRA
jgi:hypothetical protein